MKKFLGVILSALLVSATLTGCGGSSSSTASGDNSGTSSSASGKGTFDTNNDITVVSREDGSGTRGAFIELFGIEEKDASGNKVDKTTTEANITNNTSVMMTSVQSDEYAIGYISLGSLNNTVKALKIDGALPSIETIKDGSYKISRPFNIATKDGLSEVAQDFVAYILSTEGQKVVEENGYITAVDSAAAYTSNGATGKITVAGSSSVTPVMEKLKEAYLAVNKGATIEVQQSDSTTGMTSAAGGICDIGMASRELKDSEKEQGLKPTVIALDGIAVIVNNNNTTTELKPEQVKSIFTGETLSWADLSK